MRTFPFTLKPVLCALALTFSPLALSTAQSQTFNYDMPAGPLGRNLAIIATRSGVSLSFEPSLAEGLQSPALNGEYTPQQALKALLEGSGLVLVKRENGSYTVQKPSADGVMMLDPVKIQGKLTDLPKAYAGGLVAGGGNVGLLGNINVFDTPFNITSYTAELIDNQQARTIEDVVANDPSVRASWPSTGYTNPLVIRGFAASNQDISFDGLYGVAPTFAVGVNAAERVEVLKGPGALLTGMQPTGSVGGGINIVPKRAQSDPTNNVTLTYASDAELGGNVDIGRRFGDDDKFGIRFNGTYSDGDTAVDNQARTFGSAIVALDYQGERLRTTLDLGYQEQDMDSPTVITRVTGGIPIPKAPKASSNWFFPWTGVETDDTFAAARVEYDLTADWTFHVAMGRKKTNWSRLSYFPTVINAEGDISATPSALEFEYRADTQEAGLRGDFAIGTINNQLSLTATRFRLRTDSASARVGSAIASNIYNPVDAPFPGAVELDPAKASEAVLTSYALSDVISLYDDQVKFILGLRHQSIETDNFNLATGELTTKYDDSVTTPSFGFVVKPMDNVSVYGNYIEGLQQGTIVGSSFDNAGETLAPFVSKQHELGIKVDWGRFASTVSAFQIVQPSGSAPSSTGVFAEDGEQRNRGIELNVFGKVTDTIRVLGGVSQLDATLTKTANGVNNGNKAPGVPELQLNVGVEWDTPFMRGLMLSSRAIYTDEQQVNSANTQRIPSWTRLDIGASYSFKSAKTPITVRVNVNNVTDNDYWSSAAYFGWVSPGAPRTLLLSVSADF